MVEKKQIAEAIRALRVSGYCLLENVIDSQTTSQLLDLSLRIADTEVVDKSDYLYSEESDQRIWSLLRKSEAYFQLALHPVTLRLMRAIFGQQPLLSNLSANIKGPGGTAMVPHWDQDWAPRPWPHPLVAHAIWMLTDFTADNGATALSPGSHLMDHPPPDKLEVIQGTAGSLLCFDGRLWHGTQPNTSTGRRVGILAYYCQPFIRQQENFALSLPPSQVRRLSRRARDLLGFGFWEYLGMTDGPPRNLPRY